MAVQFQLDLETQDGKSIEALKRLIALRKSELGNTTKQTLIAIAVTAMKSLRSNTKVANENKANITVEDMSSRYVAGFENKGKRSKNNKRIVRKVLRDAKTGAVATFDKIKVCWKLDTKDFSIAKVFGITDTVSEKKKVRYFVVAESESKARSFAKEYHKRRVRQHKSLAKLALSISTYLLGQGGEVDIQTNSKTYNIGKENAQVEIYESGYDSGDVEIKIHDKLDYAAEALKSGASFVEQSFQKSMNQATGYLIHKMKQAGTFDNSFEIPFPEVKRK